MPSSSALLDFFSRKPGFGLNLFHLLLIDKGPDRILESRFDRSEAASRDTGIAPLRVTIVQTSLPICPGSPSPSRTPAAEMPLPGS
jgi:hypothetical protein